MLDWSVRILCNEFELGGSFSVLIFVGTVPDDPEQWATSPTCVGIHDVYTSGTPHNSDSQEDLEVEGYVRLNGGLLERFAASELTPDVVVPFLKRELHWRVQNTKGEAVQMQSLKVVTLATPISQVPGETFPVVGESHPYHDVTYGRSGGSRHV